MKKYITIEGETYVYRNSISAYVKMGENDRHEKAMADNKRRSELLYELAPVVCKRIALTPSERLEDYIVDNTRGYLGLDREKLRQNIAHRLSADEQTLFWELEELLKPTPPLPPLPEPPNASDDFPY